MACWASGIFHQPAFHSTWRTLATSARVSRCQGVPDSDKRGGWKKAVRGLLRESGARHGSQRQKCGPHETSSPGPHSWVTRSTAQKLCRKSRPSGLLAAATQLQLGEETVAAGQAQALCSLPAWPPCRGPGSQANVGVSPRVTSEVTLSSD